MQGTQFPAGVGEIAATSTPARLAFLRNALSTAARRTSSTPSPCLLALRKNAAPLRRVACRDFPRAAPPNVILARAPQRIKEARNVRAKRGRAGRVAWSGKREVQEPQVPGGVGKTTASDAPERRNIFCARPRDKAKAYWRYVKPQSTTHCAKRQAERAWRLPRFSQDRAPNVTPNPHAAAHKRSAQCSRKARTSWQCNRRLSQTPA